MFITNPTGFLSDVFRKQGSPKGIPLEKFQTLEADRRKTNDD